MDTDRTRPGEERLLLHLPVRKESLTEPIRELLFFDLSGEDYKELNNSPSDCVRAPFVKRADHFVLVLDGTELASPEKRESSKLTSLMLLRSCLDSGQLDDTSLIEVVITKLDELKPRPDAPATAPQFLATLKAEVTDRFASRVGNLLITEVAARAKTSDYPLGFGLDALFPLWVEELPRTRKAAEVPPSTDMSEYDNYARRYIILTGA
jgi:hypothetical protein